MGKKKEDQSQFSNAEHKGMRVPAFWGTPHSTVTAASNQPEADLWWRRLLGMLVARALFVAEEMMMTMRTRTPLPLPLLVRLRVAATTAHSALARFASALSAAPASLLQTCFFGLSSLSVSHTIPPTLVSTSIVDDCATDEINRKTWRKVGA